jgi:hypothetical protein
VSDPRLVEQLFLRWVQATEENAGNQPVDTGALTAEDWGAARRALGPGSRSLLFGTSTKVLDAIARRFKEQAPAAVTPSEPDPEAGGPKSVGVTLFHHEVGLAVEGFERTEQSARPEPPTS